MLRQRIWLALTLACFLLLPAESVFGHQPHDPIVRLAVSPGFAQDHTVFIATAETSINMDLHLSLRSTDGAITWEVMPLPNAPVRTITVSPNYAEDQTLYVGTWGAGIHRSTDGGASWQPCGLSTGEWSKVSLSAGFAWDHTLLAVNSGSEIHISTDRGDTWTLLQAFGAYSTAEIRALVLSPSFVNDDTLYIATVGQGETILCQEVIETIADPSRQAFDAVEA